MRPKLRQVRTLQSYISLHWKLASLFFRLEAAGTGHHAGTAVSTDAMAIVLQDAMAKVASLTTNASSERTRIAANIAIDFVEHTGVCCPRIHDRRWPQQRRRPRHPIPLHRPWHQRCQRLHRHRRRFSRRRRPPHPRKRRPRNTVRISDRHKPAHKGAGAAQNKQRGDGGSGPRPHQGGRLATPAPRRACARRSTGKEEAAQPHRPSGGGGGSRERRRCPSALSLGPPDR